MSSQIAAKLPISCGIRAGRAMNHQCRCSLPSPQLADVDAADLAHRAHCALDPAEHDAKLRQDVLGNLTQVAEVLPRLEDDDDG